MAAPAPILGIDPKLYRHFAAVTLLISISVAMFASGEGAPPPPGAPAEAAKAPTPQPTVTLTDKRGPASPPPDDAAVDDELRDDVEVDSGMMPEPVAVNDARQSAIQIEIDPRQVAHMTPQQQADAMKQLEAEKKRREAQAPYRPTALELQNLRNASALRSGSNGDD